MLTSLIEDLPLNKNVIPVLRSYIECGCDRVAYGFRNLSLLVASLALLCGNFRIKKEWIVL